MVAKPGTGVWKSSGGQVIEGLPLHAVHAQCKGFVLLEIPWPHFQALCSIV